MHPAVSGGGEVTSVCPDKWHDGDPVTEKARRLMSRLAASDSEPDDVDHKYGDKIPAPQTMSDGKPACSDCRHPRPGHSKGPFMSSPLVCPDCPDEICILKVPSERKLWEPPGHLGGMFDDRDSEESVMRNYAEAIDETARVHMAMSDEDMVNANSPFHAAANYMRAVGLDPTEDAIEQLVGPFTVCLRIMCERGYEPSGQLWKRSGVLGVLTDVQKKFDRFWYRTWTLGRRHDDSGYDLINFTGMCLRQEPDSRFGEWGEPAQKDER